VPVVVGATVVKPTPIFTKLDEAVVDEELERLRDDASGDGDG
jgi:methionyl-tRNA synthetase